MKVLSEETSSYGETWDGDVSFLKDTKELIMIGLHPERNSVAIRNKVYKRGVSTWGFQWVDVSYPQSDGRGGRHYTFEFGQSELRLMCEQTVSPSNFLSIILSCYITKKKSMLYLRFDCVVDHKPRKQEPNRNIFRFSPHFRTTS